MLFTATNADAHSIRLQGIQSSTNDLVTWNAADWTLKVNMATYIARRLIQTVGLLFLLSIMFFALVNLAPGGPLAGQGQSRHIGPEKIELLKRQFGLDKPLPTQYLIWLVGNDWMKVDADGDGTWKATAHARESCAAISAFHSAPASRPDRDRSDDFPTRST